MSLLRRVSLILIMLLFVIVAWVGISVYLTYTDVPIKGELLGFDIDFVATKVDDDLGLEKDTQVVLDFTQPIESSFQLEGVNDLTERIDEELLVEPQVFHDLQSDAVLEVDEEEEKKEEMLEDHLEFLDDDVVLDFGEEEDDGEVTDSGEQLSEDDIILQ